MLVRVRPGAPAFALSERFGLASRATSSLFVLDDGGPTASSDLLQSGGLHVSRPSYAKALDKLLRPLGFRREGYDWIRIRGDMWECVNLQISWVAGVTANVAMKDLETEKLLQAIPCETPIFMRPMTVRIGHLINNRDRWWRNAPNGPTELTEAVATYGLPWFDKVRTPEEQAARWYGRHALDQWRNPRLPDLAATLYRLGEIEEALALFDEPTPRTAIPSLVAAGRCVQRWLASKAAPNDLQRQGRR
ncbi:MAG: DUF4304 domain-containing protein [Phenylobacterium sp.]|nr:MAG: DUF4304 domain-containing protein [Phenylobacterium sp.]